MVVSPLAKRVFRCFMRDPFPLVFVTEKGWRPEVGREGSTGLSLFVAMRQKRRAFANACFFILFGVVFCGEIGRG